MVDVFMVKPYELRAWFEWEVVENYWQDDWKLLWLMFADDV